MNVCAAFPGLAPRDRALPARHRFTGEPRVGRVPRPGVWSSQEGAEGWSFRAAREGILVFAFNARSGAVPLLLEGPLSVNEFHRRRRL